MVPYYFPILLIFIGGLILTVGDIIMKKWVINETAGLFIAGMLVYLFGLVFLAISYKYKNIAVASTMFVVFNIITLSIVSWLYFKETLSPLQITGIMLGIIAVVLLEIA